MVSNAVVTFVHKRVNVMETITPLRHEVMNLDVKLEVKHTKREKTSFKEIKTAYTFTSILLGQVGPDSGVVPFAFKHGR